MRNLYSIVKGLLNYYITLNVNLYINFVGFLFNSPLLLFLIIHQHSVCLFLYISHFCYLFNFLFYLKAQSLVINSNIAISIMTNSL